MIRPTTPTNPLPTDRRATIFSATGLEEAEEAEEAEEEAEEMEEGEEMEEEAGLLLTNCRISKCPV